MASPRVAVLMSVHEAIPLRFVQEAVESILAQGYPSIRSLIYCDGRQRPEVSSYLDALPRDRSLILRAAENRGLPAALNHMLDLVMAEGDCEFVARMDADDVSEPDRIEKQVAFMLRRPEVGVLGSWCTEIDEDGRRLFVKRLPTEHAEMLAFMARRIPLAHPTVMMRASVFAGGARYSPHLRQMQDYDLWSRLAAQGVTLANLPEPLLRFRVDRRFYERRAGWSRASQEARLRYEHMRRFGLRTPGNLVVLVALLGLRLAPAWAKKLAYRYLR